MRRMVLSTSQPYHPHNYRGVRGRIHRWTETILSSKVPMTIVKKSNALSGFNVAKRGGDTKQPIMLPPAREDGDCAF